MIVATNIEWEDENDELPIEVDITKLVEDWDMDMDEIGDWMSETYGVGVVSFEIERRDKKK